MRAQVRRTSSALPPLHRPFCPCSTVYVVAILLPCCFSSSFSTTRIPRTRFRRKGSTRKTLKITKKASPETSGKVKGSYTRIGIDVWNNRRMDEVTLLLCDPFFVLPVAFSSAAHRGQSSSGACQALEEMHEWDDGRASKSRRGRKPKSERPGKLELIPEGTTPSDVSALDGSRFLCR